MLQLYRHFMERLSNLVEPSAGWQRLSQDDQDQLLAKANFNPVAFSAFMMVARERDLPTAMRDAKAPGRLENATSEVKATIPKKGQFLNARYALDQRHSKYAAAKSKS